jgi:hypothetical protein
MHTHTDSAFEVVIYPGCGERQPKRNRGCRDCGYLSNDGGRLLSLAELLAPAGIPGEQFP